MWLGSPLSCSQCHCKRALERICLGKICCTTKMDLKKYILHLSCNVAKRQVGHNFFHLRNKASISVSKAFARQSNIVMCNQDSLGLASGSRSINQRSMLVDAGKRWCPQQLCYPNYYPTSKIGLSTHRHLHAFLSDSFQVWQVLSNFKKLLQLSIIFHHHNICFAIVGNVLTQVWTVCGLNPARKSTSEDASKTEPFRQFDSSNAYPTMRLQAQFQETLCSKGCSSLCTWLSSM